jgi:hypothetical protein
VRPTYTYGHAAHARELPGLAGVRAGDHPCPGAAFRDFLAAHVDAVTGAEPVGGERAVAGAAAGDAASSTGVAATPFRNERRLLGSFFSMGLSSP